MIKVNFIGNNPNMYQVDRSYNQPNFTGAVQWNGVTKCLEVSTGNAWQRIDNTVEFNVSTAGPDVWAMWNWIEEQKKQQAKEKELRSKYPALDEAYKHAELIRALVEAGPNNTNEIIQT
jgi:hypothetical protein